MKLDRFDVDALRRGLVIAIVIALPAGLVAGTLDRDSAAVAILSLVVFIGLALGASIAAERQQEGLPLAHGIACALLTVLAAQVIGTVRRIVSGDDLRIGAIVSNVLLALIAGTIGGLIGSRRQR